MWARSAVMSVAFGALLGAPLGAPLGAASAVAQSVPNERLASQKLPPVLSQRALISPRAEHALLLGVAIAGRRLVAVGERGIVLLSDDNGGQWRQASIVPVAVTLTAVRFASARVGWAVGHLGVILYSSDGGETWQRQLDGVQAAILMHEAAEKLPQGEARTASLASADQLVADGPDKPFLDLLVEGEQILAVGAYGLAVRSSDSGRSWAAADLADPQGLHLYGLSHLGDTALVAGEQGFLAVAQSAAAFQPTHAPYDGTFFGTALLPGGAALAFGLGGALVRTDDVAGGHWVRLPSGLGGAITCAVTLPDGRILLGSDRGELALSDASGQSFSPIPLSVRIPITDMLVDDGALILTGPAGPRQILLKNLKAAT